LDYLLIFEKQKVLNSLRCIRIIAGNGAQPSFYSPLKEFGKPLICSNINFIKKNNV